MLSHEVTAHFFIAVVDQARGAGLMSQDHFSVDGPLIQAWGLLKSFRPKDDDDRDNTTGKNKCRRPSMVVRRLERARA